MKTIEAANIIKAHTTARDNAIIAKQGMTGVLWNYRHVGSISKAIEDIADDVISGAGLGWDSDGVKLRKIAKEIEKRGAPDSTKNPHAVALGRAGGLSGGKAKGECKRRNVDYAELGRKSAEARKAKRKAEAESQGEV